MEFKPFITKESFPALWKDSEKIDDIVEFKGELKLSDLGKYFIEFTNKNVFIAGSSAMSMIDFGLKPKEYGDVDFFFTTEKALEETFYKFIGEGFTVAESSTEFQIQLHKKDFPTVSLVKYRFFNNLKKLLDTFDFTVTQIGFNKQSVYLNKYALEDFKKNAICVHILDFQTDYIFRLSKYIKKGYEPTLQCVNEIERAILKRHSLQPNPQVVITPGNRYESTRSNYNRQQTPSPVTQVTIPVPQFSVSNGSVPVSITEADLRALNRDYRSRFTQCYWYWLASRS